MDKATVADIYELGDRATSDVVVRLRNKDGRPEWFYCHSSILSKKSKFFADRLSVISSSCQTLDSHNCIEVCCSGPEYDHYVKLLRLFYLSDHLVTDSWDSVRTALGVLQAATALCCEEIAQSCIEYLEAVPWEEKEEDVILKTISGLGPVAMPILARIQPVDLNAVKHVFISAIRFATSKDKSLPPFTDDLKTSAQEQVEYMLAEDEDLPLVTADSDIKAEVKIGLSKLFSAFESELNLLLSESDRSLEEAESKVLQCLSDLEWVCSILPKMDMLKDFVCSWVDISVNVLAVVQDKKLSSGIWAVKVKLIEVTAKVLDAVGYGNVVLPAPSRVQLLKIWLPYIRTMKPLLDSKCTEDEAFPYKMDADLCQGIEGAIISLVLALPSNDQADILTDWMEAEQVRYPDLSEAFEVWCYRTKAAKRRLEVGFNEVGNATVSL
ncbi:BTB/POZ domain-containing protein At3g05675-like [Magnolia sinica]|uniref:BTB/POZ domain-containing protein At3g05675-like n=1 Tax=Magnolia sinica TaxID=86752 RepID=UPI00265ACBDB|nr:BTB/POZ domain-containing protein At3g05675-like [Magnolia sinica]XP_058085054.1 BTB/POZ domain-containing protein At3g05675-like [Magnolia sinica]